MLLPLMKKLRSKSHVAIGSHPEPDPQEMKDRYGVTRGSPSNTGGHGGCRTVIYSVGPSVVGVTVSWEPNH